MVRVFTSALSLEHDTGDHVESKWRYVALQRALDGSPLCGGWTVEDPGKATMADLLEVHTPQHCTTVQGAVHAGRGFLDVDTVVSPQSMDAALSSVRCAVSAGLAAKEGEPAFAVARPPGHHATPTKAMGFCLFNNIAIAARRLQRSGLRRIAIVDHDVHHGNGTQDAFIDDPDVLFVSLHESPLYPGTGRVDETGTGEGEGFTINIPYPPGTGHDGYLELVDRFVVPVLDDFDADMLLVSAGFDAHHDDPLANTRLVHQSFPAILDAIAHDRKLACVLEGGYDLDALAAGVVNELAWMCDEAPPHEEPVREGKHPAPDLKGPLTDALGDRWRFA